MSIDGVVKGDIPPTAAVGWGFRPLGARPVASAHLVKNLGLRDPKTGLLPGQAKKEDKFARVETVEDFQGAWSQHANMGTAFRHGEDKETGPESANLGRVESNHWSIQHLKKEDSHNSMETGGSGTARRPPLSEFDTRDDLIQLYVESSQDALYNMRYTSHDDAEDAADSVVNEDDAALI